MKNAMHPHDQADYVCDGITLTMFGKGANRTAVITYPVGPKTRRVVYTKAETVKAYRRAASNARHLKRLAPGKAQGAVNMAGMLRLACYCF